MLSFVPTCNCKIYHNPTITMASHAMENSISQEFPIKKTPDYCKPYLYINYFMKNRSTPRKPNILTLHYQPKGLEGSDSQAKMWRHSTPSSASALKGPTPPPQSVATINLGHGPGPPLMSMGREPVKLGEKPVKVWFKFLFHGKVWRANNQLVNGRILSHLLSRLPTFRGGLPAKHAMN